MSWFGNTRQAWTEQMIIVVMLSFTIPGYDSGHPAPPPIDQIPALYIDNIAFQEVQAPPGYKLSRILDNRVGVDVYLTRDEDAKVVTGVFPAPGSPTDWYYSGVGCIYVTDSDGAFGIKVAPQPNTSTAGLHIGDKVIIAGMYESIDGERQISASTIIKVGTGTTPLYRSMPIKNIGGKNSTITVHWNNVGLYNTGLPISVVGKVLAIQQCGVWPTSKIVTLTDDANTTRVEVLDEPNLSANWQVGDTVYVHGISMVGRDPLNTGTPVRGIRAIAYSSPSDTGVLKR
jgi:hypothetical protein